MSNPFYEAADLVDEGWTRGSEHLMQSHGPDLFCAMGALKAIAYYQFKEEGWSIPDAIQESVKRRARMNARVGSSKEEHAALADVYIKFGDEWVANHPIEKRDFGLRFGDARPGFGLVSRMYQYNDGLARDGKDVADMLREIGDAWEEKFGPPPPRPLTRREKFFAAIDKRLSGLPKVPVDLPIIRPAEVVRFERELWAEFYANPVELTPKIIDLDVLDVLDPAVLV